MVKDGAESRNIVTTDLTNLKKKKNLGVLV